MRKEVEKHCRSFPYQLYKKLRPDVAKAIGDDDQALIKHYLKHGAKDNVPIQETLNNLSVVVLPTHWQQAMPEIFMNWRNLMHSMKQRNQDLSSQNQSNKNKH